MTLLLNTLYLLSTNSPKNYITYIDNNNLIPTGDISFSFSCNNTTTDILKKQPIVFTTLSYNQEPINTTVLIGTVGICRLFLNINTNCGYFSPYSNEATKFEIIKDVYYYFKYNDKYLGCSLGVLVLNTVKTPWDIEIM